MERASEYLSDVPFIGAENIATRLGRGITQNPDSWESLIATAQRVIGHFQNESLSRDADARFLYITENAKPLIAAARIVSAALDAVRKEEPLDDPLAEEERQSEVRALRWLAASAFAAAGNFPSAAACLQHLDLEVEFVSQNRRILFALFNPTNLGHVLLSRPPDDVDDAFIEDLNSYHATGSPEYFALVANALNVIMRNCKSDFEAMLLRSARLSLLHQKFLSTVSAVMACSSLSPILAQELALGAPTTLLPAQWAVINAGLLKTSANSLITLPTSTGKTLLAQLAILADVLPKRGVGVFVAPYIAIARQTAESFKRFSKSLGLEITLALGAARVDVLPNQRPQVFIVTPERLESLLNTSLPIALIDTIVFDEAHIIENGVRGARLKGLLTRFRLQQITGGKSRIILMSAALRNIGHLRDWLGIAPEHHYDGEWRPTARRIAFWQQTGRLSWIHGTDPIRPDGAKALTIIGSRMVRPIESIYATDKFPQMRQQWPAAYKNVAYLVEHLGHDIDGPALVVCMTRRSTRGVAHAIADRFEEISFGPRLQELENLIQQEGAHLFGLLRCIKRGVAYHNASLPSNIRLCIENALKSGELRVIASTTTLAEGADLPFRLTILFEWLQGIGTSQQPISGLLFRNIAGRAGRAGSYIEGDTIIFENVLGNVRYTKRNDSKDSIVSMLMAEPTLQSSLHEVNQRDISSIQATFEASFVGAISENPNVNQLAHKFLENSFSKGNGFEESLRNILDKAQASVLSDEFAGPIGIAASPIRLTPFGNAVRTTSLSPDSARKLLQILPKVKSLEIDDVAATLLMECGSFPEQNFHKLRDLAVRRKGLRFVVKETDLATLSRQWRTGVSLLDAFKDLPKVQKSATKRKGDWILGEQVPDWDQMFDGFLDFMESAFGIFVPTICRCAEVLAPFWPEQIEIRWADLVTSYERRSDLEFSDTNEVLELSEL